MNNSKTEPITDFLANMENNVGTPERVLSSIGGGALLLYGIRRGGIFGTLASLVGGSLAFRGVTGHCHLYQSLGIDTAEKGDNESPFHKGLSAGKIHVTQSVTINKSPAELYQFWHNFENLPQFMTHLESVTVLDGKRSRWRAKAPFGTSAEWEAETTSDIENERIGWKSVENSQIPNSGVVEFRPTSNRGTELRVVLTYEPPAGELGALVAKLFGEEPNQQVREDLRRFKQLMESGTIMTVDGQTSGRLADETETQTRGASA
ncbi:MAG: DUF2892 domain-containing protein [Acidobacteriota bacterium]|nr:DUF2892 domain-containing protein [Acidobacteriota bacterium]